MDYLSKSKYISNKELAVLLSVNGISKFYGFELAKIEDLQEVLQTLFKLSQKQIAYEENGKIKTDYEWKKIITTIAKPRAIYELTLESGLKTIFYLDEDNFVMASQSRNNLNLIKISYLSIDRLSEEILEQGFTIDSVLSADFNYTEDAIRDFDIDISKNVKSILRDIDINSYEENNKIYLVSKSVEDFIVEEKGRIKIPYVYSKKLLKEKLKKWERKNDFG